MQLMILEVLSFVSFYLMILLVFFQVEGVWSIPIYLYSALVLIFFQGKCKKRNWKTTVLLGVSLSLPMLLYFTLERVLFTLLFAIGCIYYYEKFMGRLEMEERAGRFKVHYSIMTVLVFAGILVKPVQEKMLSILPFMMLYLFSEILLSVTLRQSAYGTTSKKNNRRIYVFLILAMVLSLIISVEGIRIQLLYGTGVLFGLLQKALFFLLYPLLYVGLWIFTASGRRLMEVFSDSYVEQEIPGASPGIGEEIKMAQNSDLWGFVLGAGLLVVIMVIGYFVYKKRRVDNYSRRPLNEKREYLISKETLFNRKKRDRFPSGYNDQIRYYYRKYLRKIKKNRMLEVSDTSQSISLKGDGVTLNNDEIRDLYIQFRYGGESADKDSVGFMKKITLQ